MSLTIKKNYQLYYHRTEAAAQKSSISARKIPTLTIAMFGMNRERPPGRKAPRFIPSPLYAAQLLRQLNHDEPDDADNLP